jgi:hypothetical protein
LFSGEPVLAYNFRAFESFRLLDSAQQDPRQPADILSRNNKLKVQAIERVVSMHSTVHPRWIHALKQQTAAL